MTVKAELIAADALREYLMRTLPAKCDSINAERAAVLKAARAEPYNIPAGAKLVLGTTIGTELGTVDLTAGAAQTSADVAADITAAGLAGITASSDSQGRLVIAATATPAAGAPSTLWLGPDADGAAGSNAIFGWGPGGRGVAVSAVVPPNFDGIVDGEPDVIDASSGFTIVMGRRTSIPRANIRTDTTLVTMSLSVYVAEPNGIVRAAQELIGQCVRAVRECIVEDRTLDGAVFITEVPNVQYEGRTFRFQLGQSQSGLMSEAPMTVLIKVFERN